MASSIPYATLHEDGQSRVIETTTDFGYLEAKTRQINVYAAISELRSVQQSLTQNYTAGSNRYDEPYLAHALKDIGVVLRLLDLEAHNLTGWNGEHHPGFFAQQIHVRAIEARQEGITGRTAYRLAQVAFPYLVPVWQVKRTAPTLARTLRVGGEVVAIKATRDGKSLITVRSDGQLTIWDLETGQKVTGFDLRGSWYLEYAGELSTQRGSPYFSDALVAFAPDDNYVVNIVDNDVAVWNIATTESFVPVLKPTTESFFPVLKPTAPITALAVTSGGQVIVGDQQGHCNIWDVDTRRWSRVLAQARSGRVTALAVTDDRKLVAAYASDIPGTGTDEATLAIWDLETGQVIHQFNGHSAPITGLVVTPDGKRVLTAGMDGKLIVWDLQTGRVIDLLAAVEQPPVKTRSLAGYYIEWNHVLTITHDGKYVISGDWKGLTTVWDLHARHQLHSMGTSPEDVDWPHPRYRRGAFASQDYAVRALSVTPDDKHVISGTADGTVKIWRLEHLPEAQQDRGHTSWVNVVTFTPDGARVISGSDDGTLKYWNRATGTEIHSVVGHQGWVLGSTFTPDGQHFITASADGTLKVWEPATLQEIATLRGDSGMVCGVAALGDGHIVSASADGTLRIWDLRTRQTIRVLEGHTDRVIGVVATADGRRAISASTDHTLKVWDLDQGEAIRTLYGHTGQVDGCVLTTDDRYVVSTSYDRTLRIWDLASGKTVHILEGHTHHVQKATVTRDGCYVLSVSKDRTLRVWDWATGEQVALLALDAELGSIAIQDSNVVVGDASGNVVLLRLEFP